MGDRTPADGSVTRDLREWGDARFASRDDRDAIERIADRIDEDHERAVEKAHCEDISDIGDDELSSLYGLVRLPVDANGDAWHVGDKLSTVTFKGKDDGFEVTSLKLYASGWSMDCTNDRCRVLTVLLPSGCVHRRPTPAERIRRCVGLVEGCYRDHGTLDAAVLDELRAIADELEGDE